MAKVADCKYDAFRSLELLTGVSVSIDERKTKDYDAIVHIDKHPLYVIEVKNEVRKENEGFIISMLTSYSGKENPKILVAKYIASETAKKLKDNHVNYLDISGNCYIKTKNLFIYVSGQKVQRKRSANQSKVFQETGIKLLFHILSDFDNLQLPYRKLSELAEISIGSVSNVMAELEKQHFIRITKKKRVLMNKSDLLEKWIFAYHDVLRPRLAKKQMHFVKNISLNDLFILKNNALWGGEPGVSILTNHLIPEQLTIYTEDNWQDLGTAMGLVPDDDGNVEVLHQFWKKNDDAYTKKQIVPPLLIYADLIGSGYGRNVEVVKMLLNNELQHLK